MLFGHACCRYTIESILCENILDNEIKFCYCIAKSIAFKNLQKCRRGNMHTNENEIGCFYLSCLSCFMKENAVLSFLTLTNEEGLV